MRPNDTVYIYTILYFSLKPSCSKIGACNLNWYKVESDFNSYQTHAYKCLQNFFREQYTYYRSLIINVKLNEFSWTEHPSKEHQKTEYVYSPHQTFRIPPSGFCMNPKGNH